MNETLKGYYGNVCVCCFSSYRGKGEGLPAAEVTTQPLFRELPEQGQWAGQISFQIWTVL